MRLRPWALTAAFVALFAVIATLAYLTALGTAGAWYGATISLVVYVAAMALGTALAMALVLSASATAGRWDARLRQLDAAILRVRTLMGKTSVTVPRPEPALVDPMDAFVEGLDGLEADLGAPSVTLERSGHDTLVDLRALVRTEPPQTHVEILRELVRERMALRQARAALWRYAAGPSVAATFFLLIGAIMVPGSDGFAAAHYQLNTTLVLFVGYAFAPLVAWALLSLALSRRV